MHILLLLLLLQFIITVIYSSVSNYSNLKNSNYSKHRQGKYIYINENLEKENIANFEEKNMSQIASYIVFFLCGHVVSMGLWVMIYGYSQAYIIEVNGGIYWILYNFHGFVGSV